MFSTSEQLQGQLYHQAQKDLDQLAHKSLDTGFSHGEVQFYKRMFKRKLFTHYYSRVKQLA
jgi:hypothetical protein